jgi:hypothetical protein
LRHGHRLRVSATGQPGSLREAEMFPTSRRDGRANSCGHRRSEQHHGCAGPRSRSASKSSWRVESGDELRPCKRQAAHVGVSRLLE